MKMAFYVSKNLVASMSLIAVLFIFIQRSQASSCGYSSVCCRSSPCLASLPPLPLTFPSTPTCCSPSCCECATTCGQQSPFYLPPPISSCPLPAIELKSPCCKAPTPCQSVTIPNIILALLPPSAKTECKPSGCNRPVSSCCGRCSTVGSCSSCGYSSPFTSSSSCTPSYRYGYPSISSSSGCCGCGGCGCGSSCCLPPPPITIPVPQPIPYVVREQVQCAPEKPQPSVTIPNIIAALLPPTSKSCQRQCCGCR